MKKLLLVNPVGQKSGYLLSEFSTLSPLGLAYVGAVTPAGWEVKIADENCDKFEFEEADLVGISAFTSNINRAYDIARLYRNRKIKVVIGGIHASMLPDEALQFADAVVVGEVEGIWKRLIDDFENNRLSPKYKGPRIDFAQFKISPRRDLLNPQYRWHSVQTSRGCPFNCYFCSVSRYMGKEYRQRRAEDVLDELKEIEGKYIAFVDNNLIGSSLESKNRAVELFKGMIDRGLDKKWWAQTSMDAAGDNQVLELAAEAGCMCMLIGFETISKEKLKIMKKGINLKIGMENYKKVVDTFHKYGIGVFGAFIIGTDYESPTYYKELADFLVHAGIDIIQITCLTPLPGTELMRQLKELGLLIYENFPQDWDKYRFSYMVHQPQGIKINDVYSGNNYIKNRIYSFPTYQYRTIKSLFAIRKPTTFYAVSKLNQALKKNWQNAHYYRKYPLTFDSND
ncbi:MAG: radical SAM protein [Thermodesulfobacteriota bacterium]|nr:radical SAM protein [Thermodesulfobacteriota bacterium]